MKTAAQAIENVMAKMTPAKPAPTARIDVAKWADYFEFDLRAGGKDNASMRQMVEAGARFIKAMKDNSEPYWLSLLGTSGAGKTYLAKRIVRWHVRCGLFNTKTGDTADGRKEVVYPRESCWWPELASELKGNAGYGTLRDIQSADFAFIDEIGAELDKSGHVTNCLANLLCGRVGKWTLITSNKSLGEIQREIDLRVASRMIRDGSVVLDVAADDYSLWKRKKGIA